MTERKVQANIILIAVNLIQFTNHFGFCCCFHCFSLDSRQMQSFCIRLVVHVYVLLFVCFLNK